MAPNRYSLEKKARMGEEIIPNKNGFRLGSRMSRKSAEVIQLQVVIILIHQQNKLIKE